MQTARAIAFALAFLAVSAASASAEAVNLTEKLAEVRFSLNGKEIVIARGQDQAAVISGDFAKTSRPCPAFCIQPMTAVDGVTTLGELEVLEFLQGPVAAGTGALLDGRLPEWFAKGSIPGAVNVPFPTLAADNPLRNDILVALGAKPLGGDKFDFSAALDLVVFCNGIWSDQSLHALQSLQEVGYPIEKLHYYRGGMQDWQILGLSVAVAGQAP